jgi:hypothetical protein
MPETHRNASYCAESVALGCAPEALCSACRNERPSAGTYLHLLGMRARPLCSWVPYSCLLYAPLLLCYWPTDQKLRLRPKWYGSIGQWWSAAALPAIQCA